MANFLTYLKKHNINLYSLVVSLLLALWYNGIAGLLNYWIPVRGPLISSILLLIPIVILLTDDGNLNELYNAPASIGSSIATMASQMAGKDISNEKFTVQNPKHHIDPNQ
jgi:hypothetical protein